MIIDPCPLCFFYLLNFLLLHKFTIQLIFFTYSFIINFHIKILIEDVHEVLNNHYKINNYHFIRNLLFYVIKVASRNAMNFHLRCRCIYPSYIYRYLSFHLINDIARSTKATLCIIS